MKKLFFFLMALSLIFPVLSWGEKPYDKTLIYAPRSIVTGDAAASDAPSGEIVRYRYNPLLESWEYEANKATIKYNHVDDKWTYAYPGEILRFNPVENEWDYQFPKKRLRYDITTEKWFYGYIPPSETPKYDEMLPPGLLPR